MEIKNSLEKKTRITLFSSGRYVAIFLVVFTLGVCVGTRLILSDTDASTVAAAIVVNGYQSKISGSLFTLVCEYLWRFLLIFTLVYVCLYSRIGNIIINILPLFYGLYVGISTTSMILFFEGGNITYLIFGVFATSVLHSVIYMCMYSGVILKCQQIYGSTSQNILIGRRGLSIMAYLVIYLLIYISEIIVYSIIY